MMAARLKGQSGLGRPCRDRSPRREAPMRPSHSTLKRRRERRHDGECGRRFAKRELPLVGGPTRTRANRNIRLADAMSSSRACANETMVAAMSTLTKLALGMMGRLRAKPARGAAAVQITLPPPHKEGGMPLMEALANRRSSREFMPDELPLQLLSDLLWAAAGMNRAEGGRRPACWRGRSPRRRRTPRHRACRRCEDAFAPHHMGDLGDRKRLSHGRKPRLRLRRASPRSIRPPVSLLPEPRPSPPRGLPLSLRPSPPRRGPRRPRRSRPCAPVLHESQPAPPSARPLWPGE